MKENLPFLIIAIAALAGAAGVAYVWLSARRQHNETQLLIAEIRKWEDEGGNVSRIAAASAVSTPEANVPPEEPATERLQRGPGDTAHRTAGRPVVS